MSEEHLQQILRKSIDNGDLRAVRELIMRHDVPVDMLINKSNTLLSYTAEKGNVKIADYLIQQGAFIDHRNSKGNTGLMIACFYGHSQMVKLLLKRGANAEAVGSDGNTAVDWAQAQNNTDVVKIVKNFIKHGAASLEDDQNITDLKDVDTWTKVSDTEIEHVYYRQQGYLRITDIFNFADRERTRYAQDIKTSTMISTTRNFSEIEGMASLKQAFTELKAQGGAPDSNAIGQFRTIKRRKKTPSKPTPPKT